MPTVMHQVNSFAIELLQYFYFDVLIIGLFNFSDVTEHVCTCLCTFIFTVLLFVIDLAVFLRLVTCHCAFLIKFKIFAMLL